MSDALTLRFLFRPRSHSGVSENNNLSWFVQPLRRNHFMPTNEPPTRTPAEALAAITAADCSTAYRTKSVTLTNDSGWNLKFAYLVLRQEHDLPPPSGYATTSPLLTICVQRPPHSVCTTDPCPLMGAPILATRAQCSAKFELNGQEKDINFPDYVTPVGTFISACGWGVNSQLFESARDAKVIEATQAATGEQKDVKR